VLDLAILGFFKYSGFIVHNINQMLPGAPAPELHLALPLGISFFTFQLISYVADVHTRAVSAERDPSRFAAYILMFPHLIAGPIVRYADIRDELHADRRRTGQIGLGIQYFIVGLCQKTLVANTVAPLADHAFGLHGGTLDAATAWLGAFAYALQIYFDFCGYSNMAIGLAFMIGFTYPKNFDYPYAARSVTEFWRRWHISLSSWFRDYVYIPLGGNRGSAAKTIRNLLIVFLLTGFWHGAAWNFVLWGLYHGAFLMLERFGFNRLLAIAPRLLGRIYLILAVVIGWVLFRADSLPHALDYVGALFSSPHALPAPTLNMLNAEVITALSIGAVLSFPVLPYALERLRAPRLANSAHLAAHLDTHGVHVLPTAILLIGLLISVARLAGSSLNPFLYFRF
jgi:alginate O-acetyltransferase complex protein AlgI